MNRILAISTALALCATAVSAQQTADWQKQYERQVSHVGVSGLGVKSILDRWAEAEPANPVVYVNLFQYWLDRAKANTAVVPRSEKKYLGQDPVLALKDSLGRDVYYFQETIYDDAAFTEAMHCLDIAIDLKPDELQYRFFRITSIMDFEKDSPDIANEEINTMIDRWQEDPSSFLFGGEPADDDLFCQGVGEYCYRIFMVGTPAAYEYFYGISSRMSKLYPDNPLYLDNLGSYWKVARGNNKKALQYYRKALKADPTDQVARYNIKVIESTQSQKGRSSK